jgi:hypothetical protein
VFTLDASSDPACTPAESSRAGQESKMTREEIRNLKSQFITDIYRRFSFLQEMMPTGAERQSFILWMVGLVDQTWSADVVNGFNGVEKFLNKEMEELEK